MNKVSVIIPVKDDEARLKQCVACITAGPQSPVPVEIIVVDNGSRDPVLESWFVDRTIRVLRCPDKGSYAARNVGIAEATGDILAFTDSDCLPQADWIKQACDFLAEGGRQAVAGRVDVFPQDPQRPSPEEYYEMLFAFPQSAYVNKSHFGVTANLFVRREVFGSVGCFNEQLYSGGDREWGIRAWKAGVETHYSERVVVRHPARSNWKALKDKVHRTTKGLVVGGDSVIDRSVLEKMVHSRKFPLRNIAYCIVKARGAGLFTRMRTAMVIWRLHMETTQALRKYWQESQ